MVATHSAADNQATRTTAPTEQPWVSGGLFLILLAVALFVIFARVLLGLDAFVYRDFGSICYPQAFYERESLLRGEMPFWNPYNYCGSPFLAQWGTWYPTFLLHAIFPVPWSVNFFHLLHLVWAGCGMFWLARRWETGPFASAFAGFAYVFNGVTLSCLMWPGYIAFLAWSPWVLGCTMAAWKQGGRWLTVAAASSAMQVLACAPELLVIFWGLLGVLWLVEVARGTIPLWPSLRRLAIVVALAAGITMVQMLPFFDLLLHSQRDPNFGDNKWAMPGWGWANLLVPLFRCYRSPHGPWFQPGQELVCSYYLGAGVLVLAVAGAFLKGNRPTVIMGVVALICWIMALGSGGLLFDWVRHVLPQIGIARYPVKFALFPVFLVPLLAAFAVDTASVSANGRHRRVLLSLTGVILLLMAGLLWTARKYAFPLDQWDATAWNTLLRAILALALLSGLAGLARTNSGRARLGMQVTLLAILPLDALTHNPRIFPTLPIMNLSPGIWAAAMKQAPPRLGEARVMASPEAEQYLNFHGSSDLALDFTGRRLAERSSLNLLDNVPKVARGGLILRPAYFDRLERNLYSNTNSHLGRGLLDFLSVAWISSAAHYAGWAPRTNYLPVVTAGQRPAFVNDDRALRFITADEFDPRQVVYLTEQARSLVSVTDRTECRVLSQRFSAHHIEVDIEASETSLIVLSQSYYHLWRARVDGILTPLLRGNLAFQALQVPAGRHHVTLVYRDGYFVIGATVSILALTTCVLIWFQGIPFRKHISRQDSP
jgi:hypothetical protein